MHEHFFLGPCGLYKNRIKAAAAFVGVALLLYTLQAVSKNNAWFLSNWFVGDGISIASGVQGIISGQINLGDIEFGRGVFALYYPAKWGGDVVFFLINLASLIAVGWRVGFGSLVLYPYFLVAMALPSKDVLVLFATIVFIIALFKDLWFLAILVTALSYFLRDGSVFVLISVLVASQAIRRNYVTPAQLVVGTFVFGALLFSVQHDIFGDMGIVARNYGAYANNASSLLGYGSPFDYFVRVFGNATNLAFRPAFIDENGGISVLGIAFFISGISMFVGTIYSVWAIISNRDKVAVDLSIFFLVSLAVISLNPHIQGRYQFPFGVILSAHMLFYERSRNVIRIYIFSLVIACLAIMAYHYSGIPGPPQPKVTSFSLFDKR